jgi:hypothetical protein
MASFAQSELLNRVEIYRLPGGKKTNENRGVNGSHFGEKAQT